ncbi:MAG: hypothetical protein M3290_13225 [Actinomycetota bacterium]|nr:hypothetical protein [Actinomycetota bacterium]
MSQAGWWTKVIVLGSLAAWALVGIGTGAFLVGGQAAPRAFANACLGVAGLFALGVLLRFGGSFLRYSRVVKTREPIRRSEDRSPDVARGGAMPVTVEGDAGGRPQAAAGRGRGELKAGRYGMVRPDKGDAASLAFAVLATLVMVQVLVLGFVIGTKA